MTGKQMIQILIDKGHLLRLNADLDRLRASNAALLTALKRIADLTCGCMSSNEPNWHYDKCWKATALAAIAQAEKS